MSKNSLEIITLNKPEITDFAKERNHLLNKSKADWLFFLDTDEVISPELHVEIEQSINGPENGYYVFRKNYLLGKYVGTDKILRLGKKGSGKWERSVHEVWIVKGKVGQLKNPLVHNTAKNLHEYIDKINFYSTLHARENLDSGKRSNIFRILVYPPTKFFQSLIMGRGFVISVLQSFHSFLAWSKEWQLQKNG